MPALITHHQFALRVFSKLKKAGIEVADHDMALIGAQGPDIFFFHRALPWQRGECRADLGGRLHKFSPARLFEGFRVVLNTEEQQYNAMLGYVEGFFCHYALDRAAHPYVLWAQQKMRQEQPAYGTRINHYHYRIESALDTMTLRRETGRLIGNFDLTTTVPRDRDDHYSTVGRLYQSLLFHLLGATVPAESLALAPGDMRHTLFFMNDRTMLRQKLLLRPFEKMTRRGHFASSLMRPADTSDWDYANEAHASWYNPFDRMQVSVESFFDLYEFAANEAADMIAEFLTALPNGKSMQEITQDRGFASDLPGVYNEAPLH